MSKACLGCRTIPPLDDERSVRTSRIIRVRWAYSRTSLQGKVHPTKGTNGESLLLTWMVPSPFQASDMLSCLEEKYERTQAFVVHANVGRIDFYTSERHTTPASATSVERGIQASFLGQFGLIGVTSIGRNPSIIEVVIEKVMLDTFLSSSLVVEGLPHWIRTKESSTKQEMASFKSLCPPKGITHWFWSVPSIG